MRPTADVGEQAGRRPAQRNQTGLPGTGERFVGPAARGSRLSPAAQRSSQDDRRLDAVPDRPEVVGEGQRGVGVGDRGRALTPHHGQLRRHPGVPNRQPRRAGVVHEAGSAGQRARRRREPADAQGVGGQADERVGAAFGVPTREGQGLTIQRTRPIMPAELAVKGRSGAEPQRSRSASAQL